MSDDDVPAGYIRGDDGQLYRHRIVGAVTTIAIAGANEASTAERAAEVERAMSLAVLQALDEGVPIDSPEIRERILAARDAVLDKWR